jgi:hypothetical protein
VQRMSLYRFLTFLCFGAAATAAVLAAVAFGLAHGFEAGAAALCALVFFIPGLLFLRYWQRLGSRELALAHAAAVAEEAGVADAKTLAEKLEIPAADATKIVRIAIREGRLRGELDPSGRFIAASTPRCAACGTPVPRSVSSGPCPSCGKPVAGGS